MPSQIASLPDRTSPGIRPLLVLCVANLLLAMTAQSATAQVVPEYQGYSLLGEHNQPGLAAQWAAIRGRATGDWFQPIQVIVDADAGDAIENPASITIYHGAPIQGVEMTSPAQLGVLVGHSYRLRVTNLDGLPGVEVFPSIEILDRLHPPAGQKDNFPVPIHIDRADIEAALSGKLVTRVVYLEQPQLAMPFEVDEATRTRFLKPVENAVAQADRYGRPMAIVRIGGRLPASTGETASFYGTGGPVVRSLPVAAAAEPAPRSEETAE